MIFVTHFARRVSQKKPRQCENHMRFSHFSRANLAVVGFFDSLNGRQNLIPLTTTGALTESTLIRSRRARQATFWRNYTQPSLICSRRAEPASALPCCALIWASKAWSTFYHPWTALCNFLRFEFCQLLSLGGDSRWKGFNSQDECQFHHFIALGAGPGARTRTKSLCAGSDYSYCLFHLKRLGHPVFLNYQNYRKNSGPRWGFSNPRPQDSCPGQLGRLSCNTLWLWTAQFWSLTRSPVPVPIRFKTHFNRNLNLTIQIIVHFRGPGSDFKQWF